MSIKPIDLQTLFAKMDEVSKEQNLAKEQAVLRQTQAAGIQVARELEEDHRVGESAPESESRAVSDDESQSSPDGRRRKKQNADEGSDSDAGREVVTDPGVGRHIDLSG